MRRRRQWIVAGIIVAVGSYVMWNTTARSAYESPEYRVTQSDGSKEIREYPSLVLATTSMRPGSEGGDGSFMRLFGYISGDNAESRKVAMTVPVFMEQKDGGNSEMGFVVPTNDVDRGVPAPSTDNVRIRTRPQGRYATIRFSGRITPALTRQKEAELVGWLEQEGLVADSKVYVAGYDPPWLPGFLRRNEVLIRLKPTTP